MPRLEIEGIVRERFSFPSALYFQPWRLCPTCTFSLNLASIEPRRIFIGDIEEMVSSNIIEIAYFTIIVII